MYGNHGAKAAIEIAPHDLVGQATGRPGDLTLTNGALGADVTRHPVQIDKDEAQVLDRPGLGIEVDEDLVRRHRIARKERPAA